MFSVDHVPDGGRIIVKVAESLEGAVGQAPEVRVDLSEVTFLDSTGIRSLVQAYRSSQSRGGVFYVVGARQWVAKVLDVTGVGPLLAPPAEHTPKP